MNLQVLLNPECYYSCLCHTLTTEEEEVVGLLLGSSIENENYNIVTIKLNKPLKRTDKKKDRTEVNPQQLSNCLDYAENLTKKTNKEYRIVGWYHSHPKHINVFPSEMDLKTQMQYQQMDPNFVGLIFSTFNQESTNKQGDIRVTCFQAGTSKDGYSKYEDFAHKKIPLYINPQLQTPLRPVSFEPISNLSGVIFDEQRISYLQFLNNSKISNSNKIHTSDLIYYSGIYQKKLAMLIETLNYPILQNLQDRLEYTKELVEKKKIELRKLKNQNKSEY
ncbi:lys-63-specific deubiquitinase brcc36-related [Anaeramoeba flamelloides]|uniref:Lys-63-specific deubiquitinase brcc36-related n=1 Tax=Anaeramoeba flamelloides TaxID=1746091 RepID=A0AAV7Y8B3_9EUKA|nr:lys-63-specific deubiquitinase brcc36-related [Anaeramoeba flamelloides]